jgi:hypothetical protein
MSDARGQRGKVAEAAVRKYLERLNTRFSNFDFERKYDARSAGGRFPSQAGDFSFYRRGIANEVLHGLIEVKEVAHDYRLPKKNFEDLGRPEKRRLAGGIVIVVVLHTTTGYWRLPPFDWIYARADKPSWDLREFQVYETVAKAFNTTYELGGA